MLDTLGRLSTIGTERASRLEWIIDDGSQESKTARPGPSSQSRRKTLDIESLEREIIQRRCLMFCTYAAGTDVGKRDINQDSYVCHPKSNLWLVADGVGGLAMGETASAITSYTLARMISSGEGVNQAIETTHAIIREFADSCGVNMGAALVLVLAKGNLYNIFWAGDCRAYLFDGSLKPLTRDHTHSQFLIDAGHLTEEEAATDSRKDGITKAVGIRELDSVEADRISDKWQAGQKILLCSDGLSGYVADEDICAILNSPGSDQDRVDQLISLALKQDSLDNITAIILSAPDTIPGDDDDTKIPDKSVLDNLGVDRGEG